MDITAAICYTWVASRFLIRVHDAARHCRDPKRLQEIVQDPLDNSSFSSLHRNHRYLLGNLFGLGKPSQGNENLNLF